MSDSGMELVILNAVNRPPFHAHHKTNVLNHSKLYSSVPLTYTLLAVIYLDMYQCETARM